MRLLDKLEKARAQTRRKVDVPDFGAVMYFPAMTVEQTEIVHGKSEFKFRDTVELLVDLAENEDGSKVFPEPDAVDRLMSKCDAKVILGIWQKAQPNPDVEAEDAGKDLKAVG